MGLDITPTIVGITGVARYAEMLWTELLGYEELEIRAFGAGRGIQPPFPARVLRLPLRVLYPTWRLTGWPRVESLVGDVDVVHSIDLMPPPTRRPLVMTIHDALTITHPELLPIRARKLQHRQLRAAEAADVVVTTCRTTAETILGVTSIRPENVIVAPLGVLESGHTGDASPRSESYLLAVGAVTPRKGFEVLAEAMSELGPDAPRLIIAGPDGWMADRVRQRVERLDRFGRIRFVGGVSDVSLADLYRNATLVCHPSLAEGFGISCLEAMSFGRTIVASDVPSVREMADGCVRFVTIGDPSALASAIQELLTDETQRDALSARAFERAKLYSWRRMSEGVVGAYERAVH